MQNVDPFALHVPPSLKGWQGKIQNCCVYFLVNLWYNAGGIDDNGGDGLAKHEFGIMQNAPESGRRYDEYEPHKYNCISVDDDYLEDMVSDFNHIDFYWHTLDVKGKGLAYCGITLIPPYSMQCFKDVIKHNPDLYELKELSEKALKENKWIIHFGL